MAWSVAYTPTLYVPHTVAAVGRPVLPPPPYAPPVRPFVPAAPALWLPRRAPRRAPPVRPDQQAALRGRFYLDVRGRLRVFNASEYRFYRSNSGPPAESDSPFATNATLPHTPADTYADGTWYLSVSWFNGVLDSGFLPVGPHGETYLRLDIASGAEVEEPPGGPLDWRLELLAGGVVRIHALYWETTAALRAGVYAIAYTIDGSTPPAGAPDVTVAIAGSELSILEYDLPAQSHGVVVKVRLQTRRGTSYSEGSTVKQVTIDSVGPSAPLGAERWPGRLPGDY